MPTAIVVFQSLHARHTVSTAAETGGHASATAVTTPSVPSLPMNSCFRSYLHTASVHACCRRTDERACLLLLQFACHMHTLAHRKEVPLTLCCPCDKWTSGPAQCHPAVLPPRPAHWHAWIHNAAAAGHLHPWHSRSVSPATMHPQGRVRPEAC